jgi:hypothetical protein
MKKRESAFVAALVGVMLSLPPIAHADGDHSMSMKNMERTPQKGMDMPGKEGMFLVKRDIDGYQVSFHVMKPEEGMQHGGSHNFMVKIEEDGKVITNVLINSKVVHPDGTSESKMMMKMGDWFMAGYDLGHDNGRHQMMVLFKTADGKKHFGGVYYHHNINDQPGEENEH